MEAAVAPLLPAGDGGTRLAANEAALERAQRSPQRQAQGLRGWPHTSGQGAGCGHCWLTAYTSAWHTRLLPVPGPLWSCWEQVCVPELVEGLGFLSWGPGGAPTNPSWCKPALARSSPSGLPPGLRVWCPQ